MPPSSLLVALFALLVASAAVGCGDDDNDESRFARPGAHLLSEWLGVPEDSLAFESAEAMTWPNGCMGIEWRGRVCSQAIVNGHRLTFRSQNDQPHYVHVNENGDYVWAPIWETETEIVSINGNAIQFTPTRGGFSSIGRLTNGTLIEGTPRPGSKVYAAESSAPTDTEDAPIVVLVVLEP